jgi:hypothetical protein
VIARRIALVIALIGAGWLGGRLTSRAASTTTAGTAAPAPPTVDDERDDDPPTPTRAIAPPTVTDQYALLAELRRASAGDPEHRDAALATLSARWRGVHVRWHMLIQRALCAGADSCYAVPFDHADARASALVPIIEGWLPALHLDAASMARLAACGPTCAIDVTGTLAEITASSDQPFAIAITAAAIDAAGPPTPSERWTP